MKKRPANSDTVLYLFNLKSDLDDPILSFSLEWIEEFAKNFKQVKVFSTHKGRIQVSSNVEVVELGGGSFWSRVKAVLKMYRVLFQILTEPQKPIVFHHMSIHTITVLGLPLKLAGIKQGMWYSHSAENLELRFASWCVTKIFSSSPAAFPIKSMKAEFIGHGIKTSNFLQGEQRIGNNDYEIVSIGRITSVKSLEKILEAIHASNFPNKRITFIGPTSEKDEVYREELKTIGQNLGVEIEFHDAVSRNKVPSLLGNYGIFYTGTPRSTDKAAIEAAISGCYVLSENSDTRELLGMSDLWKRNQLESPTLMNQLEFIANRPRELISKDRQRISSLAAKNNELSNLIEKVILTLKN
jgi:glycosyltransferase involved in cell wall biosynthesis